MGDYRTLLVPYDFSPQSDAALLLALDLGERLGASVHLLHVVQGPSTEHTREIQQALKRVAESPPCGVQERLEWHVLEASHVTDGIREVAQNVHADFVVMGTSGHAEGPGPLGSVAAEVVCRAPCPVLTVRVPEPGVMVLPAWAPPGTSPASQRLETLSEATARLAADGFDKSFQAQEGALVCLETQERFAPQDLVVREIVRFEGDSDPGDMTVLFALRTRDARVLGTLVAGYGAASADADTAAVIEHLEAGHHAETRGRERAIQVPSADAGR
jgi:nucleotide-binding universal stress UspA family protein